MDGGEDDVREPSVGERGRLLSRWAAMLASLPTDRPQPWRLCEALRKLVGADGAAITIAYLSDARTTVCATDEVISGLESLQEVLGEGPGPDAARTSEAVVADIDGSSRWPMLAQAVDEQFGPLRLHAIPLDAGDGLLGVVTFYTPIGADLAEPAENAVFLVNAAGPALAADSADHSLDDGDDDPWSSRAVVHQATGMIMAQLRVPPGDALALLRGHAYALETDVADVAERVIDRSINFSNFEVEGD
ncbi:GAF and ANTAR domain-containing protein [Mumia qirimensis]|uniref:GAF and ANTAR domain-containing protein n=1 Tax=Mumia qirimensis TaxID=3234852 RepID=UPI00351D0632